MNNTTYSAGTISVGAGSTTVAGVGTAWLTSGVRAGDVLLAAGNIIPIATVNANATLTLKRPWPAAALAGSNYDIMLLDDDVRSLVAANELLQALKAGTLTSLAGLAGGANKLPYFTGTGVMAQTDLSVWARTLLDDADVNAFWATVGATSAPAQAFRRGNVLGTVTQASGVPSGALIEKGSNANGDYVRFADGTQICTRVVDFSSVSSANNIGSLYRSAVSDYSFPAAFSGAVLGFGGGYNPFASGLLFSGRAEASWRVGFAGLAAFSAVNIGPVGLIAIGRWF